MWLDWNINYNLTIFILWKYKNLLFIINLIKINKIRSIILEIKEGWLITQLFLNWGEQNKFDPFVFTSIFPLICSSINSSYSQSLLPNIILYEFSISSLSIIYDVLSSNYYSSSYLILSIAILFSSNNDRNGISLLM